MRGMVNFELSPLVPVKTVGGPEALARLALLGNALWAATDGTGIFKYPESAAWVGPREDTSPRNQNRRGPAAPGIQTLMNLSLHVGLTQACRPDSPHLSAQTKR